MVENRSCATKGRGLSLGEDDDVSSMFSLSFVAEIVVDVVADDVSDVFVVAGEALVDRSGSNNIVVADDFVVADDEVIGDGVVSGGKGCRVSPSMLLQRHA